jgi:tetratricopeptide (TPR) repeat protein
VSILALVFAGKTRQARADAVREVAPSVASAATEAEVRDAARNVEATRTAREAARGKSNETEAVLKLADALLNESTLVQNTLLQGERAGQKHTGPNSWHAPEVVQPREEALALLTGLVADPNLPNRAEVEVNRGELLRLLGRPDEQLEVLAKVTQEYPNTAEASQAHLQLGNYAFEHAEMGKAEKQYRTVITSTTTRLGDRNLARYRLAWIDINNSGDNKKTIEAVVLFEQVLRSQPDEDPKTSQLLQTLRQSVIRDLATFYPDAHPAQEVSVYLRRLNLSPAEEVAFLKKLANRYYVALQDCKAAAPLYRQLLQRAPTDADASDWTKHAEECEFKEEFNKK